MSNNNGKPSAINVFFLFFIASAILLAAYNGSLKQVMDASFSAAKGAVDLSIGLIGIMALWLGFVRILEAGGFMLTLAKWVRPLITKLFPDIPENHPAMGAMLLNISANMLGLGNAATPFGLKAMTELQKLNPIKDTATNAMCLFLAINTSSITVLPLGVIGVRAAAGSDNPASIFIPTLLATITSTIVAIIAAKSFAAGDKKYQNVITENEDESSELKLEENDKYASLLTTPTAFSKFLAIFIPTTLFAILLFRFYSASNDISPLLLEIASYWLMPALMLAMLSYGLFKGVKLYEAVTDGAKQGFDIAIRIIPFLVTILVAVGMFRASGAMEILINLIGNYSMTIGLPAEALPVALLRPLSGTGAFAVMSELINNDPNSYASYVASILMGSTETTFYVISIYFGSVGIVKVRHALIAGILADIAGILAASFFANLFYY